MEKRIDVVALGELLVDMAEGEKSQQGNLTFEACPGGAPCNVLSLLCKAGHACAFIGKVGDDFLGNMLATTIEDLGISTEGLIKDKHVKTTLAFVHKKEDGDRDFSFYRNPGADMMLTAAEVNEELIRSAHIFHFGTLSLTDSPVKEATQKAVSIAKENGLLISFDPNLREPLWKDLKEAKEQILWGLGQCDILKISDNEVEFMTGCKDMEEGLLEIQKMTSARLIFVTLGKDGSMCWAGNAICKADGEKVSNVVDTTGAGDTFMGSVLHYLLELGKKKQGGMLSLDELLESGSLSDEVLKKILCAANKNAAKITQFKGALKVIPKPESLGK